MLFSKSFIFTLREDPKIAECNSHRLLLKGCFLHMVSSGIYAYLPLGKRVLDKVSNIIRKYMGQAGAAELTMSALQPIDIWQKTGRDEVLKDIMFRFKDRKDRDLCLGPTHEEEVTEIAKKFVNSYKQMPVTLYQIQTKFRDEPRPRFGVVRGCEFVMKDAYSFDIDEAGLDINYQKMFEAYQKIFTECGLNFIAVEADSGAMGGKFSHEFMVPAPIGEDILYLCSKCSKYHREAGQCPDCGQALEEKRMIEAGHVFKLGTKYSQSQEALFVDRDGKRKPMIMGCYGIGVSRLLAAIAEQCFDDKGIIWPKAVAPFDVTLTVLDDKLIEPAKQLAQKIEALGLEVLIDDRNEGAGVKFNDAYLIGNPYMIIMGKTYIASGKFDIEIRKTRQKQSFDEVGLFEFLKTEYE
jgi:prolyl-tRNA synthetase